MSTILFNLIGILYPARPDIQYLAKLLAGYPVVGYLAKSVSGATLVFSMLDSNTDNTKKDQVRFKL